jgi:hypothetical protein
MTPLPTWADLRDLHCTSPIISKDSNRLAENPYYEDFAQRRYNYSPLLDKERFRFVFLKSVLSDSNNKTLVRGGRFIWCHGLLYEGRDEDGLRKVSFSVDKGCKRFVVSESNILSVPSKIYVSNNKYFRTKDKTFNSFSSVFGHRNCIQSMAKNGGYSLEKFEQIISDDNVFKPGSLVAPRLGYIFPEIKPGMETQLSTEHPCGIILGTSFLDDFIGREFYRVRFGDHTYERVHPIQMEIINEV